MPHNVFANYNEIAAKSADGSSLACHPDVCFSPGAPMPGIPLPYPNSVFAGDLDNLSKTVEIKGTGAALEEQSYFATSYGDEAATQSMQKGLISGKVQGKAYFKSWSLDVKIEGLGVARHMDTVTHNHVNQPNAMVQKYRSVWEKSKDCQGDREKVQLSCNPKDPSKNPKKKKGFMQKLGKLTSLPDEMAQKTLVYRRNLGNAWVEDYCDGLWIKPMKGTETFTQAMDEIKKFLNQDIWSLAQTAFNELLELAKETLSPWFLFRKLGGLGLRSLLKEGGAVVTGATGIGLVVSAGLTAWTISDVVSTATEIAEAIGPRGIELLKELTDLEKAEAMLKDKLQQWKDNPSKMMADTMTAIAIMDSCIRARKCMLVPFDKTDSLAASRTGEGCCPGQTGHHVLPGSMFGRRSNGTMDPGFSSACSAPYDHDNAPTICLEGSNNSHGSHGVAHSRLRASMEKYKEQQSLARKKGVPGADPDRISYTDAREQALDAVRWVAPHCDRDCLRAQLDAYYKACDKKNTKNLKATSGGGSLPAGSNNANDADF